MDALDQMDLLPRPGVDSSTDGVPSGVVLALAPMEGVTDALVRDLLTSLGGIDYCVTEFLRVASEPPNDKVLLRECPELSACGRTSAGVPVHVQLLGGDPQRMAETAARAVFLGAPVIDLNYGCPAKTVNRHDGGASLLRTPWRVEAVTRAVRDAVPPIVPVSAKIRLGWENPDDVDELARAAEAGGAAWITIHGRTKAQGYKPPADWARIGRARAAVRVPVVANGDLASREDIARCARVTGCTRFMLGRGAIARPELFRVLRGLEPEFWPASRRVRFLERFVEASILARPGEASLRGILQHLKQWCRAMAAGDPAIEVLFEALKRSETLDAARDLLARV